MRTYNKKYIWVVVSFILFGDIKNFRKNVKNLDSTYEWLIILLTLFQASILQYVMWFWNLHDITGYIMTTRILIILILPFVFSISTFIIGYVYDNIYWAFRLRMFSWGTIYLCIIINFNILYNYVFVQYVNETVNMIDNYYIYPSIERTPFLIISFFLMCMLSMIPTFTIHHYNNIAIKYKYLNSINNMIISPAFGMIVPYIIIRAFDTYLFSRALTHIIFT